MTFLLNLLGWNIHQFTYNLFYGLQASIFLEAPTLEGRREKEKKGKQVDVIDT